MIDDESEDDMVSLETKSGRDRAANTEGGPGPSGTLTAAAHCVGLVVADSERTFKVAAGEVVLDARRAASCLLEPVIGDVVACIQVAQNEAWVIAVLERQEGVENTLRCEGATRITTGQAPLTVESRAMEVRSKEIMLDAQRAQIAAETTHIMGRELRVVGATLKLIGSLFSTVFDRATHFSKHHLRTTEGVDRVQATHIEQDAGQLLRLTGEHTLINGEKLVKTRGGQIHFG